MGVIYVKCWRDKSLRQNKIYDTIHVNFSRKVGNRSVAYRATLVSHEPLDYFLQTGEEGRALRVSDILLRINNNPRAIFSHFIRLATNSKWSHAAMVYLLRDPDKGYDNTFLVEAMTSGVRIASWRKEVVPYDQFTVGIKRLNLDWYAETPKEQSKHDPDDPEDVHGITYLRQVRGIALDQINGLFDHKVVWELSALYVKRFAQVHLPDLPIFAELAEKIADFFKKADEHSFDKQIDIRFICSGLVQYAFFAALRLRILNDIGTPASRAAAISNLNNLHRIIFRDDPDEVIANYIRQVQSGQKQLSDLPPDDVLDLLRTTTPADFNDSTNLEWRYLIRQGIVWKIEPVPDGYAPASEDEEAVLALLGPARL